MSGLDTPISFIGDAAIVSSGRDQEPLDHRRSVRPRTLRLNDDLAEGEWGGRVRARGLGRGRCFQVDLGTASDAPALGATPFWPRYKHPAPEPAATSDGTH